MKLVGDNVSDHAIHVYPESVTTASNIFLFDLVEFV